MVFLSDAGGVAGDLNHTMQHATHMIPDTFESKDRFDARFLRLCKFNIAEILLSKQESWLVRHLSETDHVASI